MTIYIHWKFFYYIISARFCSHSPISIKCLSILLDTAPWYFSFTSCTTIVIHSWIHLQNPYLLVFPYVIHRAWHWEFTWQVEIHGPWQVKCSREAVSSDSSYVFLHFWYNIRHAKILFFGTSLPPPCLLKDPAFAFFLESLYHEQLLNKPWTRWPHRFSLDAS